MNFDWQTIATSTAIALVIVAIINGGFARPKVKSEANKADGEAIDLLTRAQIARQIDALTSAENATKRAEKACDECTSALDAQRQQQRAKDLALDAIISALTEIVPLLPADQSATETVRAAIRTARQARFDT